MPEETPEQQQQRVVELRKAGKSYSQMRKETGLAEPTIAKILKRAGLTRARAATPSPPAASPAPQIASSVTVAQPASKSGITDFEVPAMPKRTTTQTGQCSSCGCRFEYAQDETVAACPGCGEAFE